MIAMRYEPGAPLDGLVDCFWYFDDYFASHHRERALPTGTVELVVNLRDDPIRVFLDDSDEIGREFGGAIICGAHSGYFVLDPAQQQRVIGVHFRPGGAAPFLSAPAGDFANQHLTLEAVWGANAAGQLREQLLEAKSIPAMFTILEHALLARLLPTLLPHPAVVYALRQLKASPALARIGELQCDAGYSAKHFIGLFRNSVGLTPKTYCRIQRFQSVIESLAFAARVEWAGVALDGGFYDQSHLNREFRAFAGVTPGEYRPTSPDRPNHLPIDR